MDKCDVVSSRSIYDGGLIMGTSLREDISGAAKYIFNVSAMRNLKWDYSAAGDGTTDDTTAVRAAVSAGLPIFVPLGQYKLTDAILIPADKPLIMIGDGSREGACAEFVDTRTGNPEEPLFHRAARWLKLDMTWQDDDSEATTTGSGVLIKGIKFGSAYSNPYGQAFDLQGGDNAYFENCIFVATCRGLTLGTEVFDSAIIRCRFESTFYRDHYHALSLTNLYDLASRCWGLCVNNHAAVLSCSMGACPTGLRVAGAGVTVNCIRSETSVYGVIIGDDYIAYDTPNAGLFASHLAGITTEACGVGIQVRSLSRSSLRNAQVIGSPEISGERTASRVGMQLDTVSADSVVEGVLTSGEFTHAGVLNYARGGNLRGVSPGAATGYSVMGGFGTPFSATDPSQNSGLARYNVENYALFPDGASANSQGITAHSNLMLRGLTGLNIRDTGSGASANGATFCRNLGDVVAVGNGATTAPVAFPTLISQGNVDFSTHAAQADGGSTLPAGTYYYAITAIGKRGETGVDLADANSVGHCTVVVGSGEKAHLVWYGLPAGVKARLYRTQVPGVFTDYWEIAAGGSNTFDDDGNQAFDGNGSPCSGGAIEGQVEDDANYQIVATPSWNTTVWVTSKSTTGFTLNFGTSAPDANQTVAWLMFRP